MLIHRSIYWENQKIKRKTIKKSGFMTYTQRMMHIIVKNADEIISLK